jgi:predicted nuclease of restriction endonuclease-like (RecB) superfamily
LYFFLLNQKSYYSGGSVQKAIFTEKLKNYRIFDIFASNKLIKPMLLEDKLFQDVKTLVLTARQNAYRAVDSEKVLLNWHVGQRIRTDILENQRAEFGKQVIKNLSIKLTNEFGSGYNQINLWLFVRFATFFPDFEIVYALRKLFSWTHFRIFIRLEDDLKRRFYMQICRIEGWGTRQLEERIDSMLYERTAISRKPDELIDLELSKMEQNIVVSEDLVFRDPYLLDFLDLKDTYSEKDLETAILIELQRFITELGSNFGFLARQKVISIDGEEYKIDLLFFHRRLKCLVAIDLKLRKFKPQDKGQMELYLRWLEKYDMVEGENQPIGLILCSGKSDEHIELLTLDQGNIRVSQYLTELPSRELLQTKLHAAIVKAKERAKKRKN